MFAQTVKNWGPQSGLKNDNKKNPSFKLMLCNEKKNQKDLNDF